MPYQSCIVTSYLSPTAFRAGRVKATAPQGSVTIEFEHAFSSEQAHAKAAMLLAIKLARANGKSWDIDPINSAWSGEWIGGDTVGNGYAFVRKCSTNAPQALTECGFVANGQSTFSYQRAGEWHHEAVK